MGGRASAEEVVDWEEDLARRGQGIPRLESASTWMTARPENTLGKTSPRRARRSEVARATRLAYGASPYSDSGRKYVLVTRQYERSMSSYKLVQVRQ